MVRVPLALSRCPFRIGSKPAGGVPDGAGPMGLCNLRFLGGVDIPEKWGLTCG